MPFVSPYLCAWFLGLFLLSLPRHTSRSGSTATKVFVGRHRKFLMELDPRSHSLVQLCLCSDQQSTALVPLPSGKGHHTPIFLVTWASLASCPGLGCDTAPSVYIFCQSSWCIHLTSVRPRLSHCFASLPTNPIPTYATTSTLTSKRAQAQPPQVSADRSSLNTLPPTEARHVLTCLRPPQLVPSGVEASLDPQKATSLLGQPSHVERSATCPG